MTHSFLFVFLLACSLLCSGAVLSFQQASSAKLLPIFPKSFGAYQGAKLRVDLTVQPANELLYAMLYNEKQYNDLLDAESVTSKPPSIACIYPATFRYQFQNKLSFSAVMPSLGLYTLILHNCAPSNLTVTGTTSFLNPGDNPLSIDEMPLEGVYGLVLAGHCLCATLWCYQSHRQELLGHHRLFTMVMFAKLGQVFGQVLYYGYLRTSITPSSALDIFRTLFDIFFETLLMLFLLLVALGWTVVRTLSRREPQILTVTFSIFFAFDLLREFDCSPGVCNGYSLGFHVMRFLITFGIVVGMNSNLERLRLLVLEQSLTNTFQYQTKLLMYRDFRRIFLSYLVIPLILIFLDYINVSWPQRYVSVFLNEALVVLVLAALAHTFRPGRIYSVQ